jgi:hypothetical protein
MYVEPLTSVVPSRCITQKWDIVVVEYYYLLSEQKQNELKNKFLKLYTELKKYNDLYPLGQPNERQQLQEEIKTARKLLESW